MLEKKLLTVACAIGILACGACFLPPLPEHHPPVRPQLRGVHVIRVEVQNLAKPPQVDPSAFAEAVRAAIDEQGRHARIRAQVEAGGEDAVLLVTVLDETVEPDVTRLTNIQERWRVCVTTQSTLTSSEQVILDIPKVDHCINRSFPAEDAAAVWKEHAVLAWKRFELPDMVAHDLLYP